MKTFAKKSLSVVLAMLMALSTLTVGAMSVFAKNFDLTDFTAVTVGTTSITDKTKTKYCFTPSATGYYDIALSASNGDKTAYCDFDVRQVENEYRNWITDADAWDYTATTITPVQGEADKVEYKTVYLPAQTTVKLSAGETYTIDVSLGSLASAASLSIAVNQTGFAYSYTTTDTEAAYLSYYRWNDATDKRDIPVYDVETIYSPAANVTKYLGTSTVINVPAQIGGLAVKSVNLSAPTALQKRITAVTIPEGIERISGMRNFYSLTSVNFPSTLKTISSGAFAHCHSLAGAITIPATVEEINSYAFYDTGITSVNVLGKDTKIGTQAFGYIDVLNEATPDPTDTTFAAVQGFVVLAPANSPAAVYAANNGFATYDPANCAAGNHYYDVATTPATIFAAGSTVYSCPCCGTVVTNKIAKKKFKVSSVKAAKKAITVKSSKYEAVSGYQIKYSTSKKFTKKTTKTITVKSSKALSKKITGLKSGKKYFVKVRAYNTTGEKTVYSNYSKVKSVKVK